MPPSPATCRAQDSLPTYWLMHLSARPCPRSPPATATKSTIPKPPPAGVSHPQKVIHVCPRLLIPEEEKG